MVYYLFNPIPYTYTRSTYIAQSTTFNRTTITGRIADDFLRKSETDQLREGGVEAGTGTG